MNLKPGMFLPILKIAFATLFRGTIMAMVSACTAFQTQENTLDQISTINDIRYSQVLTNISAAISQGDSVPSQGVPSNGTATTSATGMLALTLTQPFAFARNTKTFSPSVMLNWQNNWSITPISDPQDLQNLRALYGLLYLTDAEIAQVIKDTMKVYWEDPKKLIDFDYLASVANQKCGISLVPLGIANPYVAMEAYLNALNAFPESPPSKKATDKRKNRLRKRRRIKRKRWMTTRRLMKKEFWKRHVMAKYRH
jgi:hypothetical protein